VRSKADIIRLLTINWKNNGKELKSKKNKNLRNNGSRRKIVESVLREEKSVSGGMIRGKEWF